MEAANTNIETLSAKLRRSQIVCSSLEALRGVVSTHSAGAFVWPSEGSFSGGVWTFSPELQAIAEPLLVDPTTANLVLKVHDLLTKEASKARFEDWINRDRTLFIKLVNFCWSKAN